RSPSASRASFRRAARWAASDANAHVPRPARTSMTDHSGREPDQRLPARRPPSEPAPAERFSAPPSQHKFQLTPERAAKIVRQSSSARWIGFLSVLVVVLFVVAYYFYELIGIPFVTDQPRLASEAERQQVVDVERGYNLYQAN